MRDLIPFLAAWVTGLAVTFLITNASLLFWARIRWHEWHRARVLALASDVQSAPDDHVRNHLRTRYWLRRATMEYVFCPICVGMAAQLVAVLVAWGYLGWPGQVAGQAWWLAVPALLSAQWLGALVVGRLLPDVGMLADYHQVENP